MRTSNSRRGRRGGHIETYLSMVGILVAIVLHIAFMAIFHPSKLIGLLAVVPAFILGLALVFGGFLWLNRNDK